MSDEATRTTIVDEDAGEDLEAAFLRCEKDLGGHGEALLLPIAPGADSEPLRPTIRTTSRRCC